MSERCAGCGQPLYRVTTPDGEGMKATRFEGLLRAMWRMDEDLRALLARWTARAQGDDDICEGFRQCADDLAGLLDWEEQAP